jgi:hypothetical protein
LEIERVKSDPSQLQSMTVKELRELTRFKFSQFCPYFLLLIVDLSINSFCELNLEGGWVFLGKAPRKI